VSFAKVAMEICSQDGNDHLYCNDCHRGSYYWDHCTALTAHCWETEVLVKAKEPMLAIVGCKKKIKAESDFPGAIIWMVQPPFNMSTFNHCALLGFCSVQYTAKCRAMKLIAHLHYSATTSQSSIM